ncbi:MAG: ABC transporter ATP-binding protein [Actinomycetales bacterium]|nr:ABC transporter ATP-binding protein [Actinomycetales bacterium]
MPGSSEAPVVVGRGPGSTGSTGSSGSAGNGVPVGAPVVRAEHLGRRYGDVVALDGVSIEIPAGQLVGLLGPNGAGKTTLLQLLAGLRRPTSGSVEVLGGDPRRPSVRSGLGVTPQDTGLPATLRVSEVIEFVASHFTDPEPTGELLERFGLGGLTGRQTGGLSGGQRRRLVLALAFVGRPRLVLLDEPTTGLDVESRLSLWQAVRDYHAEGGTVLLTSHYLEEIEALAERVVVLGTGHVLADGSLDEVRSRVGLRRVRVTAERLPELPGVRRTSREDDRYELLTSDADALVRALVLDGAPFADLEITNASLEEAFLSLTDPAARAVDDGREGGESR